MNKIILLCLMLPACTASFDNEGIYKCVSNQGRETLFFHTSKAKVFVEASGHGTVSFTDLNGVHYNLHSLKDRDYHCDMDKVDK